MTIVAKAEPRASFAGLAARQSAFADALLDPAMAVPPGLVGPDGRPSTKRFAVYRNNVVAGLIETLKAAFPVVRRLVGDEFFAAMARVYVAEEPPASPIMLDYGQGFPGFVRAFAPAAVLPYLADVAELERAWVEAYHAAEAPPLRPSALAVLSPQEIPSVGLHLHPSVRIVSSHFPIVSIWQANMDDGTPRAIVLDEGGEDALVVRPDMNVEIRLLPAGAAVFIETLLAGSSVTQALKRALSATPLFDLPRVLSGLLEANAIVGFDTNLPPNSQLSVEEP